MKPIYIHMKNFLSFEDECFDFEGITNATVTGKNGAGKSSFCTDAITWALYGKGSRGGDRDGGNYVNIDADVCTVELIFEINAARYKVVRSLNARRGNKTSLNLFVLNNNGDEVLLSKTTLSATQMEIEKILKMGYRTFTASSMIFQGRSDEFTNGMSDAERKEALSSILDIYGWDEVSSLAKEDLSTLKGEVSDDEAKCEAYSEIAAKKQEYEDKLSSLSKERSSVGESIKGAGKELAALEERIGSLKETASDIERKKKEIEALTSSIEDMKKDMKNLQSAVEEESKSKKRNAESIEREQAVLDEKDAIEKAVEEEKELQAELYRAYETESQIKEMRAALDSISVQGKLWNSNHDKEMASLMERIKEAEKQSASLNNAPCAGNSSLSSQCPFLSLAREAHSKLQPLKDEMARLKGEVNLYRKKWKEKKEELTHKEKDGIDVKGIREKLDKVSTLARKKPVLDNAAGFLSNLIEEATAIEKRITDGRRNIASIRDKMTEAEEKVRSITEEMKGLSDGGYGKVLEERDRKKEEIEKLKGEEKRLDADISGTKSLLSQVKETESKIKEAKEHIAALKKDIDDTEVLIEACGRKAGVPSLIVENAVPELESIANRILENMMNGRLQIRLETQAETAKGTIREVLRVIVLDDGCERRYETYSGAERFVVDLALRIAMSKFLSHRAGASVQLFVLDEGVSCADESNREEIIDAIRSITGEFEKVLFVTHIEELKDALDQRIIVTRGSTGSHIRVQ